MTQLQREIMVAEILQIFARTDVESESYSFDCRAVAEEIVDLVEKLND
jgi:hypothetical protein